jgi:hypothetical protein
MATRIAWLLNLDADLELRDPAAYHTAHLGEFRVAELSARMADLIGEDDVVLDDAWRARSGGALPAGAIVLAFCPTPSALARIARLGLPPPAAPPLSVLRRVNDRRFCAELGHGMPQARFATDMAELERHVAEPSPTGRYVIKRAFSFAGREQRRVHGGVLDGSTRGFCRQSFARGEGVQVEPFVERLADFGRHAYLGRGGALRVGPTREQRCDPMGRFLGTSVKAARTTPAEDAALAAELEKTAGALSAAGYFGPFGIDAFRYRDADGGAAFNPRCEINARFTMGYPRALLLEALDAG